MDTQFTNCSTKDLWGRPSGLAYKSSKKIRAGWYFNGEFIANTLGEAKRIIQERQREHEC